MIKCKNVKTRGHQKYLCKEYGYNFIEGDRRTNEKIREINVYNFYTKQEKYL